MSDFARGFLGCFDTLTPAGNPCSASVLGAGTSTHTRAAAKLAEIYRAAQPPTGAVTVTAPFVVESANV